MTENSNYWVCSCSTINPNSNSHCVHCGKPKPQYKKVARASGKMFWYCPVCGKCNTSNFCPDCGTPKPFVQPTVMSCPNCDWPRVQNDVPAFCPDCGARLVEKALIEKITAEEND